MGQTFRQGVQFQCLPEVLFSENIPVAVPLLNETNYTNYDVKYHVLDVLVCKGHSMVFSLHACL